MPHPVHPPKTSRFILLATMCVVVAALYLARDVFIPLALAMLVSFLLAPVVNRLERLRIGRLPSVLVTVFVVFALVGVLGYVVWTQVYDLADNVDRYTGNIVAKVDQLRPRGGGIFSKVWHTFEEVRRKVEHPQQPATQPMSKSASAPAREAVTQTASRSEASTLPMTRSPGSSSAPWTSENPLPVILTNTSQSPLRSLSQYAGLVLGPLGTGGIVIVFVIFMLFQRKDLRNRLIRVTGRGQLTVATQAFDDGTSRITRYLAAQAMVNGTYGIAIALGLWLIGFTVGRQDPAGTTHFPNVILWGLLCALLRFIPYIGPWIAAAFPVLIALAVYHGFGVFVCVVILFVVVELGCNNFLEPWLYGSSTGLSTIAILASAVFWTWLWGPIGLLLATPLTVVLVVAGKYVPQLQFLDVLLGDEPAFEPPARVYQRLLALDAEEAMEIVREYRNQMPLEQVYDNMLLPALSMAEHDRHKGLLDDRRQTFIRENIRDIVEEMADHETTLREKKEAKAPDAAANPSNRAVTVVCLPAHDQADEICALMLMQLLTMRGFAAQIISHNALASEMVEQLQTRAADIAVVSALPPAAVSHARYLCKRIHQRFPESSLAVGLWTMEDNLDRARERILGVHSVQIATTLVEMRTIIDQLAHRARVGPTERGNSKENSKPQAPSG